MMINMVGLRPQVSAAPKFQAMSFIRENADTPIDKVLQFIESAAVSRIKEARKAVLEGAKDFMTLESPSNPAPYFVQGFKRGVKPYTQLGGVLNTFVKRAGSDFNMDNLYPVVKKCVLFIAQKDEDTAIKAQAKEISQLFIA